MKCAYHPTLDAAGYCPSCGRPLCQGCLAAAQAAGGCPECLRQRAGMAPARSGMPVATMVAIGCLVLLLLAAVLGGGGYIYYRHMQDRAKTPPVIDGSTGTQGAGEAALTEWANAEYASYTWKVSEHSADWTEAKLLVGYPQSEWMGWVRVRWSAEAGAYEVVEQGEIEGDMDGDVAPQSPESSEQAQGGDVPQTSGPGEAAAKAAALDFIQEPDWVVKVAEHSDDYTTVTLWVGPPASEWVYVVKLSWDQSLGYVGQSMSAFEYPD